MITAVDTCVLLDVLLADPVHGPGSAIALRRALREGPIIACAPVWAELTSALPAPGAVSALERLGLQFEPMRRESAIAAGALWRVYRARGGKRERVVADFLIGAHAMGHAERLLTRDQGFFRDYFEGIQLLVPETA